MMTDALARRYARAVFDAAAKQDAVEQVQEDLQTLARLMESDRKFRYFLLTPRIKKSRKPILLKEMLDQFAPLSLNFVELLIGKQRQEMIPQIAAQYQKLADMLAGVTDVYLTSAEALDASTVPRVIQQMEDSIQQRVRLHTSQDDELLGGLVIRIGHTVYDYSVRGQLKQMRDRLIHAA
jgi:F-type H+-transporting ATPase subunit delta